MGAMDGNEFSVRAVLEDDTSVFVEVRGRTPKGAALDDIASLFDAIKADVLKEFAAFMDK